MKLTDEYDSQYARPKSAKIGKQSRKQFLSINQIYENDISESMK